MELQKRTWFYGQMKLKTESFLAANPPDEFGANRHKKSPMFTILLLDL